MTTLTRTIPQNSKEYASKRIMVVINPISGGRSKEDEKSAIKKYLNEKGCAYLFYELTGKDNCTVLKAHIREWNPDIVVAAGGDGTVKMVAELVAGKSTAMGIIPVGSSNGMARELGIVPEINACLHTLFHGSIRQLDVISINNELSIHLSDIGLNAQLIKYFEESGNRGKWGYIREVARVLLNRSQLRVRIYIGNKVLIRHAFMVVIANASQYGTGAVINPKGDMTDGRFEIVVLRRISLPEIVKMWFKNRRFNPRKTEIFQAKEAVITIENNAYFQVDGEYRGKINKVSATIRHKALRMIVPANPQTN